MNVLWTKQKLHKIMSKQDMVTVHAHASGDGYSAPGRCCRLCGGDNSLRGFGDTYVWDGVEARYDQLLYDCFGITVTSPDCLICGCCVRQLKSTEQFRALVHAAFHKSPSETFLDNEFVITASEEKANIGTLKSSYSKEFAKKSSSTENTFVVVDKELPKPIIQTQKTMHHSNKLRDIKRKSDLKKKCSLRRTNVACTVCRQRYPAMLPKDGCQEFICSRCKKKTLKTEVCRRCNLVVSENLMQKHLELHVKDDLRTNRLRSQRKTLQVRTENKSKTTLLPKYKCSQCPKKFDIALNLINHIKVRHGDNLKCVCAVCGKEFKNKQTLNIHLKEHTGTIFQCGNCLTAFRNNRALQTHSYKCKMK